MRLRSVVLAGAAVLLSCPTAGASTLVTRGATDISLKVDGLAEPSSPTSTQVFASASSPGAPIAGQDRTCRQH